MDWESEMKNIITVWFLILLCLCYCYFIPSILPKGTFRLFSLLPIFPLFTIFPLYLSSVIPTGVTAFFITWLANFKLLLFAFDLGPLSSQSVIEIKELYAKNRHRWRRNSTCFRGTTLEFLLSSTEYLFRDSTIESLLIFIIIACLPIKIKRIEKHPLLEKLPIHLSLKVMFYPFMLCFYDSYKYRVHNMNVILVIYIVMLFLFLDVVFGLCNVLVQVLIGIKLEPPSIEPYFSTSLQDFWGRRWNIMVTNILHQTVYKPVRSVLERVIGGRVWATVLGVMASFMVSGLMHEMLFFYVIRKSPTWEVTCFFLLHGAAVIIEHGFMKACTGRCSLHPIISGLIAIGFAITTGIWLFFPPLVKNGIDIKTFEECKELLIFIKEKFDLVVELYLMD